METYNGLVLSSGVRIPFPMVTSSKLSVVSITARNHPAYNRSGTESLRVVTVEALAKHEYLGLFAGVVQPDTADGWNPYQLAPSTSCGYFVDASQIGNEMRFINDYRGVADAPNVKFYLYRSRVRGYLATVIVALHDIEAGQELLVDYGDGYWDQIKQWYMDQMPLACTECDYRTNVAHNLAQHKSRHHGVRLWYECSCCGAEYTTKQALKDHLNRAVFTCTESDDCSYTTRSRSCMFQHVRNVHTEPQFACLTCGAEFSSSFGLKRHMDGYHERKRPYSCDTCDYASAYKHDVKRHQRRNH